MLLGVNAGETLPQGIEEQATVHVTPLFESSFVTVAMTFCVAPACTVDTLGETETSGSEAGGVLEEPPPQP